MVLCYCTPSDSAGGEWHIMETKSSSRDGVCHDTYKKMCEEGKSNLESTDRNCFPLLFSQMNLTSPVHSFLHVSSNQHNFLQKPQAGINTLRTGAFKLFKCTFPGSKQFKSTFILCSFKYL